jgi:hypothetical protein
VAGKGGRQSAYMFIPDDPRIREYALEIKRARRHKLGEAEEKEPALEEAETDEREQLDLFQAISARALPGEAARLDLETVWDAEEEAAAEESAHADAAEAEALEEVPLPELESEEALAESAGAGAPPVVDEDAATSGKSARARRKELRDQNKLEAEALARLTGLGHAKVNHRLNQEVGIRKIGEATERELEARLRAAERWVERLGPTRRA